MSPTRRSLVSFAATAILVVGIIFSTFSCFAMDDLGAKVDYFAIKKIEVRGLKKVEQEAVLEKIALREDRKSTRLNSSH